MQNGVDTRDRSGFLRHGCAAIADDQQVDNATQLRCRGDGGQRRAMKPRVVVLGQNQDEGSACHDQITFASLRSFATSVVTSGTLMPAPRLAGSATRSVVKRGVTSTPSAAGVRMSSGFFFAFMMLGSVT